MELNPLSKEFVPPTEDDRHDIPGESKSVLGEHRIFGQRWNECPNTSLSSKHHRPSPVGGSGAPLSGERIGPPLLSDRSFRELNERGNLVSLLDYHREFMGPSRSCQYRLPSEIEFSEDNQWTEVSRAKCGGTGCSTSWNNCDGINPSEYGQNGDSQYQPNPANGAGSRHDRGANGRDQQTSEYVQHSDQRLSLWGSPGPTPRPAQPVAWRARNHVKR